MKGIVEGFEVTVFFCFIFAFAVAVRKCIEASVETEFEDVSVAPGGGSIVDEDEGM